MLPGTVMHRAGPGWADCLLQHSHFLFHTHPHGLNRIKDADDVLTQRLIPFHYFGLEFVIIQKPKLFWGTINLFVVSLASCFSKGQFYLLVIRHFH